jgi:TDG/mug DNA glycosylase family protein
LAVLGVTLGKILFPQSMLSKKIKTPVGFQSENFGEATVFVLPHPSGRNAHYPYQEMLKLFRQLYQHNLQMEI